MTERAQCRHEDVPAWPGACSTRSAGRSSASASALTLVLAAHPGRRATSCSRTSRGWARRWPPARSRRRSAWTSARVQFTPDLLPADLTGSFLYDQRRGEFEFRARPAVHRPAAGRRDQPHAAEDPGRAARGDAGAPGHGRGRDLPAARALPRARHRQPDRVRGHLPAARGAARPVPAAGRLRLPHRRTRSTTCSRAGSSAGARRSTLDPVTDAAGLLAMQAAVETVAVDASVAALLRRPGRGDPRRTADVLIGASPRGSLGLVLTARAFAVDPRAATTSIPEDVKAVARAGARAPDHAAAGAVDDRGRRRAGSSTTCCARCRPRPPSRAGGARDDGVAAPRPALSRAPGLGGLGVGGRRWCLGRARGDGADARPFCCSARSGLLHRPGLAAAGRAREVDHVVLHEGQGTRRAAGRRRHLDDVEHVDPALRARAARRPAPRRPAGSAGCSVPDGALPVVEVEPAPVGPPAARGGGRRADQPLGRLPLGAGDPGRQPAAGAPACARRSTPAPRRRSRSASSARTARGGRARARSFASIRPFQSGDRLRRIHWRVSLRTDELHVVSTRGEEDTAVLLVVDALADHGRSGGVDGDGQQPRRGRAGRGGHRRAPRPPGDRVGLRVVGVGGRDRRLRRRAAPPAGCCRAGSRRCRWAHRGTCAATRSSSASPRAPSWSCCPRCSPRRWGRWPHRSSAAACRSSSSTPSPRTPSPPWSRAPTPGSRPWPGGCGASSAGRCWSRLAAIGAPVVVWRGPGTLDDVLHRLARRAQLPRVRAR